MDIGMKYSCFNSIPLFITKFLAPYTQPNELILRSNENIRLGLTDSTSVECEIYSLQILTGPAKGWIAH